jgi:hypothetical protein
VASVLPPEDADFRLYFRIETSRTDLSSPGEDAVPICERTPHWQPRTVGEFNGHDVMVVKVKGEYYEPPS